MRPTTSSTRPAAFVAAAALLLAGAVGAAYGADRGSSAPAAKAPTAVARGATDSAKPAVLLYGRMHNGVHKGLAHKSDNVSRRTSYPSHIGGCGMGRYEGRSAPRHELSSMM